MKQNQLKLIRRAVGVATLMLTMSPGLSQQAPEPVVGGYNAFGFELLTKLSAPEKNTFISAASLGLALSMVENGAQGDTYKEIAKTLHLEKMKAADLNKANKAFVANLFQSDPKVKLEIANSIWVKKGAVINPDFLAKSKTFYQAEVAETDFSDSACKTINAWVNTNTHGKIASIVTPPLDPLVRLLLLDAVYFKGEWTRPFDKQATRELPFTLSNGQSVDRPRMRQSGRYDYLENTDFQAVALPYGNGQAAMYVFLPNNSSSLEKLIASLNEQNWNSWLSHFTNTEGNVQVPKFKLEQTHEVKSVLSQMGMAGAFSEDANFQGISTAEGLHIGAVIQKTFLDINEESTEAAAVTGIQVRANSAVMHPKPPFLFVVDRPFFLAIREQRTGTILFMGAINDPH